MMVINYSVENYNAYEVSQFIGFHYKYSLGSACNEWTGIGAAGKAAHRITVLFVKIIFNVFNKWNEFMFVFIGRMKWMKIFYQLKF